MSRFRWMVWIAGFALALWVTPAGAQHAGHEHGEKMQAGGQMQENSGRVVGEVIDIVCYTRMDAKGPEHVKCADYCAKQGSPLGVLEAKTGKIYLVFPEGHGNPNEKAMPFIGKQVEVVGKRHSKGGLNAITVEQISEVKG